MTTPEEATRRTATIKRHLSTSRQISAVTADEKEMYERDGVVILRQRFSKEWLDELRRGMNKDLAHPSARTVRHTADTAKSHYYEGFWIWSQVPEIENFCRSSPAATLAAGLMDARERVNLIMDNWFIREAGCRGRPPWHHDVSFFDFEGPMTVLWLPLADCKAGDGLTFIRGSHKWGKHFKRVRFSGFNNSKHSSNVAGDKVISVKGVDYEPIPDVDASPEDFDLTEFDMRMGDALFFDIRTVHGVRKAVAPSTNSYRFSLRMAKEDTHLQYRGDWAKVERMVFEAAGHHEGDSTDSPHFFPRLWENNSGSSEHISQGNS